MNSLGDPCKIGPFYVATKAGICGLTKALAVDEARNGVRVNVVLPDAVATAVQLTGRVRQGAGGTRRDARAGGRMRQPGRWTGARTQDQWLKRPLLYQLSYPPDLE